MKSLLLMRHGQSQFNMGETMDYDSDLTERGSYQIQDAAFFVKEVLKEPKEYAGFVSPYQRTLKTALPLATRWGVSFKVDSRIGEAAGDSVGQKITPVPDRLLTYPLFNWNGFKDRSARTQAEYEKDLKAFASALPDKAIIVTHRSPIEDLVTLLCGKRSAYEVSPASLTLIENGELIFMGQR